MVQGLSAWCWDARPFPDFPARSEVWADAPDWALGHWLNGRAGAGQLPDLLAALMARGGIAPSTYDVSGAEGSCTGYVIDRPGPIADAIEPLTQAFASTWPSGRADHRRGPRRCGEPDTYRRRSGAPRRRARRSARLTHAEALPRRDPGTLCGPGRRLSDRNRRGDGRGPAGRRHVRPRPAHGHGAGRCGADRRAAVAPPARRARCGDRLYRPRHGVGRRARRHRDLRRCLWRLAGHPSGGE